VGPNRGVARSGTNHKAILTRRSVLHGMGCIVAASALHSKAPTVAPSISPLMDRLSSYMSEAAGTSLPDKVVEHAKLHILDTLAAMISGSELLPGREAIRFARAYGGEKIATVVASDVLCGPIEAALANGMLAHADETDDSHAPSASHPGCAIVPAALAAGENFGITGTHFLRAVTLGYDVGTRITMTLGAQHYEYTSHRSTHAIATVFGAAAAAGCGANLDARQMRWLLNYAAEQASGLQAWGRDRDHIEKAFDFAGMSARSGVTAALVVQCGWTGIDDILSGPDNFFLAFGPDADPKGVVDELGTRFEITGTDIKKWPAGMPIQAPLDAVQILQREHPFEASEVRQVIVRLAPTEKVIVDNRELPDICLQHVITLLLLDKSITFHSTHDRERMRDPEVLRQRAKVRLVEDAEFGRLLPRRQSTVEIILADGTHLIQHVDSVRGTAANPMSREEVVAKCRDLITPVLGEKACATLTERVLDLEDLSNVRALRPFLQKGHPAQGSQG